MSNAVSTRCPQCGAPIMPNAPAGLCPNCLMALNLKTETVFTDDTSATQSPLPPEQIASHFPQLEILECLGRGGMGVVYKARQKSLNRCVALKLLAPERVTDARFAERFTREAHALAALNHPHIVTVYDFGQAGGFYFLLMEFVDGVNLRQLLQTRKLKPEEALTIVPPLCDALQYAHERGIVHRDIKPANLLLDKDGRVKIADFGIAKMVGDSSIVGVAESQPAGTPQYMAPEQKDHQRTDHRADIYSLGVVLYEMLTGELPTEKLQPPSRKVQIDVRLDEIVLRALEKTPELRFATAAEFRTQVEAVTAPAAAPLNTADSSAAVTPKAVTAATVIAVFFGILLFGIPCVEMFRVQRDSAYVTLIIFALVASTFAGLGPLSKPPRRFKPLSVTAFVAAVPAIGLAAFFALNLPKGFDNPSRSEALLVPLCFVGALALPWAGMVLWRASRLGSSPQGAVAKLPSTARISRLGRLGAGKSALIVAALGMVIWPLAVWVISRANTAVKSNSFDPLIERVEVTKNQAVVQQRRFNGEGMIITFGSSTNRWAPGGVYLEAMFDITLAGHLLGQGADWVVKTRHGIHGRYRLDGPLGLIDGKLVFHPGTPPPEWDGTYVIGEFRPDDGEPLPISIRLDKSR